MPSKLRGVLILTHVTGGRVRTVTIAPMRIGVLGRGVVGRAVEALFSEQHEVVGWDVADGTLYPATELSSCDCVFVCVPTPPADDGSADLTHVRDALRDVPNTRIILKSTVQPKTTELLADEFSKDICYCPEYIGESAYYNPYFADDIYATPFAIVGGERSTRTWALAILQRVLGPTKVYFQCTSLEAELIKYAENTFFATKVTFANEFSRICDAHGADWNVVREGWILDPRVSPMHSLAFSHDPGFGGKCLPKDLSAIIKSSEQHGYGAEFLSQVQRSNRKFRHEE